MKRVHPAGHQRGPAVLVELRDVAVEPLQLAAGGRRRRRGRRCGWPPATWNPALVARVVEVAGAGGLVDTVHTSVITLGVVTGSAAGDATAAAMWTGAVLVVLATCVLSAQTLVHEHAHPQPAQD